MDKTEFIQFRVGEDLKRLAQDLARKRGESLSDVLREKLELYVREHEASKDAQHVQTS